MYLSWIIPAKNERDCIAKTIKEVDEYLSKKSFYKDSEIIVVDSLSDDNTADIVSSMCSSVRNLRLIKADKKGKGYAVKLGMISAKGDIRLFSDADNSTSPQHLDYALPFIKRGYDIVISSRSSKDTPEAKQVVPESILRRIAGVGGNLLIQILLVPGIWDTQNGFKVFSKQAAMHIFPQLDIEGFAFDVEILALAGLYGHKIAIIPAEWQHNFKSTVTISSYFEFLIDLLRIRRKIKNIKKNLHKHYKI